MLCFAMRKFLLAGALCAVTSGFVAPVARAQTAPVVAPQAAETTPTAERSGADLLRDAHAAIATPFSYDLNDLAPAAKLARGREMVAANAPAVALLRAALKRGIVVPPPGSPSESFYELLESARLMARQLNQQAAVRAADGDIVGAIQADLDALELGAQISRGPLMFALHGFAVSARARRSLQEHAALLNAAQSRQVAQRWEQTAAKYPDFAAIIDREGAASVAGVRSMMKDFDDPKLRAQTLFAMERAYALGEATAQEVELGLEWMKFSLADLEQEMRAAFEQTRADHAKVPYLTAIKAAPVRGNNLTLMQMQTFGAPRSRFSYERNVVSNRLLVAALRLRAAKLETGAYPATFDAGVDPFSPDFAPLIYRRVGDSYLLYSVGPDGVDDNGAELQALVTDSRTGAQTVSDGLRPESTGDVEAPVL